MTTRRFNAIDRCLSAVDNALRTLSAGTASPRRISPAADHEGGALSAQERRHAAGLMRVNHTGEVCAQALYQGQALTARLDGVRAAMEAAAQEEEDHLAWCEQRLEELDARPSLFNPVFYGLSFAVGAGAGLVGDRLSLGFVAATEDQVCLHLESHLRRLPEQDTRSRAIVARMLTDEARHATHALDAGGLRFPWPVKRAMSAVAGVMTGVTYYA
ncbi:MAG: 2-polyprenyl-3-methyl-6-methoxy-1,4-benzoquinone monooxygenase [Spongiibacteraceae bacterium]|jgi:ubiquinone biosynthesis monooxygenase Coq7|nr:2-polyprenyl-3-methyl-6-methoxy-1,4-benzoquinone monooxygenase [Spongiibacteraceae bacterium]